MFISRFLLLLYTILIGINAFCTTTDLYEYKYLIFWRLLDVTDTNNVILCYFCDINFKFIFINIIVNITAKIILSFVILFRWRIFGGFHRIFKIFINNFFY